MAELTLQSIARDGLNPSLVAASAGGDTFDQSASAGQVFLYVDNAGAGSITVTVEAINETKRVPNWGDLSAPDSVTAVPNGEFRLIGPFPSGPFTGTPDVTYSDVTNVTIAAVKLPRA